MTIVMILPFKHFDVGWLKKEVVKIALLSLARRQATSHKRSTTNEVTHSIHIIRGFEKIAIL